MNRKSYLLSLILAVFIALSVSGVIATVTVSNVSHQIEKQYSPNENLKGWINISLTNEPADSMVRTEIGNGISILALLKKNQPDASFTCIPSNCERGLALQNAEEVKSFGLSFAQTKVIGLNVTGDQIDAINDIKFTVESNAPSACLNQLEIDLFDDGNIEVINMKDSNEFCLSSKTYSCFNKGAGTEERELGNTAYCQLIKIPQAPKIRAGAWIKKSADAKADATAYLEVYDEFGVKINNADCQLNLSQASSSGSELNCDIDYSTGGQVDKKFLVCLSSGVENSGYKVLANTGSVANSSLGCGYFGNPRSYAGTLGKGYQIFVEGKKFASVGSFSINKSSVKNAAGEGLDQMMQEYLLDNYNGVCSRGCTIPIKFISNSNSQQVNLYDLTFKYTVSSEGQKEERRFYDINEISPIVNSGFNKLKIDDALLSVRSTLGDRTMVLQVGNKTIFTESIKVKQGPEIQYVIPEKTAAGLPTDFLLGIDSEGQNVSKIMWFFGDGINVTTSNTRTSHAYNATGLYNLKVDLYVSGDNESASSKVFVISVGSPKEILNSSIDRAIAKESSIRSAVNTLPAWYRPFIESKLDLNNKESSLKRIKQNYLTSSSDDEYTKLLEDLIAIKIPNSVNTSQSAKFPLLPSDATVNPAYLESAGLGTAASADYSSIKNGIYALNFENLATTVEYKQMGAYYDYEIEPLVNVFKIDVKKNNAFTEEYYLFVKGDSSTLKFAGDYNIREKEGFQYILMGEEGGSIEFATTQKADFRDVPAFISPEPRFLPSSEVNLVCNNDKVCDKSLGESSDNCADCRSILPLILIIILILLIAAVLYVIMQVWYSKRYEKFLFKKPNEFFNIMTYINNSKAKGMSDTQIKVNLRKAGWSNEQIDYALKKYKGQPTGLKEIPVNSWWGKIKSKIGKKPSQIQTASVAGRPSTGITGTTPAQAQGKLVTKKPEEENKKSGFFSSLTSLFKKKPAKSADVVKSSDNKVMLDNRKPIK